MNIKERIQEDMKTSMRNQDKARLGVIRLMLAAFKQIEVDQRVAIDDLLAVQILDKMVKQRRESIQQYEAAGRKDLLDQEAFELKIIQEYLPSALSEVEIAALITQAINKVEAKGVQDMGKVMALLKLEIQGRADAGAVSAKVKQILNGLT